jgi:hypothetical protein
MELEAWTFEGDRRSYARRLCSSFIPWLALQKVESFGAAHGKLGLGLEKLVSHGGCG